MNANEADDFIDVVKSPSHQLFNALRLRALVLLLRYSGLRIRDAVTLGQDRIREGKLFLLTAKTGTVVYCPLPEAVTLGPEAFTTESRQYYFSSGESKPKSAVGDWQRTLRSYSNSPGFRMDTRIASATRLRVELLLAGVPLERVSILLGHQSTKVTEKHYSPWVAARQEQLEADVRRTWNFDLDTKNTPQLRGESQAVN